MLRLVAGTSLESNKPSYVKFDAPFEVSRCLMRYFHPDRSFDEQPRLTFESFQVLVNRFSLYRPADLYHTDSSFPTPGMIQRSVARAAPVSEVIQTQIKQPEALPVAAYLNDLAFIWEAAGKIIKNCFRINLIYQPITETPSMSELDMGDHATLSNGAAVVLEEAYKRYNIQAISLKETKTVIAVAVTCASTVESWWPSTTDPDAMSVCSRVTAGLLGSGKPANKIYGFAKKSMTILFVNDMVFCICFIAR